MSRQQYSFFIAERCIQKWPVQSICTFFILCCRTYDIIFSSHWTRHFARAPTSFPLYSDGPLQVTKKRSCSCLPAHGRREISWKPTMTRSRHNRPYLHSVEMRQEQFIFWLFCKMLQNSSTEGKPSTIWSSIDAFSCWFSIMFKARSTVSNTIFLYCFHKEYFKKPLAPSNNGVLLSCSLLFSWTKSSFRDTYTAPSFNSKSKGMKSS